MRADSPPVAGPDERSLSGVFPPLAPAATTVTVRIPGFRPAAADRTGTDGSDRCCGSSAGR